MPQFQQLANDPARPAPSRSPPAPAKAPAPNSPAALQKRLGNSGLQAMLELRAEAAAAKSKPEAAPEADDTRSQAEKQADLDAGVAEARALAADHRIARAELASLLEGIRRKYRMKSLKIEPAGEDPVRGTETFRISAAVNPSFLGFVVRVLAWVGRLIGLIGPPVVAAPPPAVARVIAFDRRQLQHAYRHAPDFGVHGNQSNPTLAQFQAAVTAHVQDAGTLAIHGTYRGAPVIHFFNPVSGLNVIRLGGNFLSGWRLSAAQRNHVTTTGILGGG